MTAQAQLTALPAHPGRSSIGGAHRYIAPTRHVRSERQAPHERFVIVREIRRHAEYSDRSGPTPF